MRILGCTRDVYRSAARRRVGIMSGTGSPKSPVQFSSRMKPIDLPRHSPPPAPQTRYPSTDPRMTYSEFSLTHETLRVQRSRCFIGPEVDLTFLPHGPQLMRSTELLMAQGVIPVPIGTSSGSGFNDRKRAREGELPGPSKRHAASSVKNEEMSAPARAQRIRDLRVSSGSNGFLYQPHLTTVVHVG